MPVAFILDEKLLRQRYLENNRRYHPDFHTMENEAHQTEMLALATQNNQAYKTLLNPDTRMHYILELKQTVSKEGNDNQLPPDFLMEMMEINEELMDLEMDFDKKVFDRIEAKIDTLIETLNADIHPTLMAYDDTNTDEEEMLKIKFFYQKKRYLLRITEKLHTFAP